LLVLAAVIGLIVSLAAWCWLTLVPLIQDGTFNTFLTRSAATRRDRGGRSPCWPWPGFLTAFAVARMPGGGGGVPAEGLSAGAPHCATFPGSFSPRPPSSAWAS
jgi:hypothetical protein